MSDGQQMIVVHVNTTVTFNAEGQRFHFPFATAEATSTEDLHRVLREKGSVFGWKMNLRPDPERPGGSVILSQVATILTLQGVAMIQDWTRGSIRET